MELGFLPAVFDGALGAELGGGARAFALHAHGRLEARKIDGDVALARDVGGQIEREAVGVVEPEHRVAIQHFVFGLQRAFEHGHAVFERFGKPLLFLLQHLCDALAGFGQFRIRVTHRLDEIRHQLIKERLLLPELVAVADRAAHDAAQHVAAPFVARDDAVDDQECARADMVGDDFERIVREVFRIWFRAPPP